MNFHRIFSGFAIPRGPDKLLAKLKLNTLRDVMYSTKLWTVTCAERRFPPRHLPTALGRFTSSRNSCCWSEVADILHKTQTAQWPEPCREPAMQGNGCWEGAKKTDICLNNMLVTNRGGTLCVPDPSHLIRFAQMQCCTVHGIQVTSCMEDIEEQSEVIVMLVIQGTTYSFLSKIM